MPSAITLRAAGQSDCGPLRWCLPGFHPFHRAMVAIAASHCSSRAARKGSSPAGAMPQAAKPSRAASALMRAPREPGTVVSAPLTKLAAPIVHGLRLPADPDEDRTSYTALPGMPVLDNSALSADLAIEARALVKRFDGFTAVDGVDIVGAARRDLRHSRAERRGQDDYAADASRHHRSRFRAIAVVLGA